MSSFLNVMNVIMNGFNQSFTVYGFTLSFWDIWLWSIIGAIVAAFIPPIFVSEPVWLFEPKKHPEIKDAVGAAQRGC